MEGVSWVVIINNPWGNTSMDRKAQEDEELDAALTLASKLVTIPVIVVLLRHAGISRTAVTVLNDANTGLLRMAKITDHFRVTTMREATRYVEAQLTRRDKRTRRVTSTDEYVEKLLAERDRAAA